MSKAQEKPFEVLARESGVLASTVAAAKAANAWPIGRTMTQKAFDKAIKDVESEAFDAPLEEVTNGE